MYDYNLTKHTNNMYISYSKQDYIQKNYNFNISSSEFFFIFLLCKTSIQE